MPYRQTFHTIKLEIFGQTEPILLIFGEYLNTNHTNRNRTFKDVSISLEKPVNLPFHGKICSPENVLECKFCVVCEADVCRLFLPLQPCDLYTDPVVSSVNMPFAKITRKVDKCSQPAWKNQLIPARVHPLILPAWTNKRFWRPCLDPHRRHGYTNTRAAGRFPFDPRPHEIIIGERKRRSCWC